MSVRVSCIGACAAAALLFLCSPAQAQDPIDRLLGQPIAGVEVQVEGKPETAPPLLALVDIKPGDRFNVEAYRRVTDRLNQIQRFENVRVLADERPSGLVLIFDLEPRHPVDRLEFAGTDLGLPAADLERRVKDQFSGLPAFTRVIEVEDSVRRVLADEGYLTAGVSAEIVRFHDPDRATMRVNVQAGPRTIIKSITVEGESPLSRAEVLKRLGISEGSPYRERALVSGLASIRDDLRGRGYYTAIADPQRPVITDAGVDLTVTIRSGPEVRLQVEGDSLPGRESDLIPIKRQGSVDLDLLDESRDAIVRELRARGYWHATVAYKRATPTPDQMLITFSIQHGNRYRVVRVELPAGLHVTSEDLASHPALKTGAWFSPDAVLGALAAVKTIYQQDGYWQVTLKPEYQEVAGTAAHEGGVVIVPNIVEGPRAVVTGVTFKLDDHPAITEQDLRRVMRTQERTPPAPFVRANLLYDQQAVPVYYESQGFLNYKVDIRPSFNDAGTEAVVHVEAHEGARVLVGEITVVGNERASRELILNEITLKPGQPYSESARLESQRRLYALSGFRTVSVTVQPRLPNETQVRVLISVVEMGSITLGFGGGIEGGTKPRHAAGGGFTDKLEFSPRLSIDVSRRNLGGRNKSVGLFSRVSLKPRNSDDPALDGKGFGFAEYRVSGTYRENGAFHSSSDLLFGVSSEQAVRSTFSYRRHAFNADLLRPLPHGISFTGRYSLEVTRTFDERLSEEDQSLVDRLFPQVRLSILSTTLFRDRKNNQIEPSQGNQTTASIEYGPRWLGSEVGFIKGFFEGSIYRTVVAPRRLIFAGRVQLGIARGFERTVTGPDGVLEVVADIPKSQRFFAGGSTTVRGFQQDRLGVAEILDKNGLSDGGNAMMILNSELRVPLRRDATGRSKLTLVGFVDGGNVFDRVKDVDLSRLRATAGFGFRYVSPFGPVRVDLGMKFDRMTFAKGRERGWEFHLSLGEMF